MLSALLQVGSFSQARLLLDCEQPVKAAGGSNKGAFLSSPSRSGHLFSSVLLALLLLAFSTSQINAKPSLPTSHHHHYQQQQQHILVNSASFLNQTSSKQPELNSKRQFGAAASSILHDEDPSLISNDELLQISLVSARGSLAFWRPPDLSSPSSSTLPVPLHSTGTSSGRCISSSSSSSSLLHTHHSSKPIKGAKQSARSSSISSASASSMTSAAGASVELVAVEGTDVKLNLVIVGHPPPVSQSATSSSGNSHHSEMSGLLRPLLLDWTLNGWPLVPDGKRFSVQVINENASLAAAYLSANALEQVAPAGGSSMSNGGSPQHQQFMLAPFVNSKHLGRVLNQLADGRKPSNQLLQQHPYLPDEFLAEGQSIDWIGLESHLHELRLVATASGAPPDCPVAASERSRQLRELVVVQVELPRVSRAERGLYQVSACPSAPEAAGGATVGCLELTFALQVVEDVPVIVTKPEHQLLEPGERLSLRCVATGYTLPQITWYLDGQQLSEQPQPEQLHRSVGPSEGMRRGGQQQQQASAAAAAAAASDEHELGQTRLRIGDYVSADSLVHSFVNSSSVEPEDAGYYRCQANNGLHSVEHEVRLDVRGPALIARPLRNTSALAGQPQLALQCPFSGAPISAVEWFYLASPPPSADQSDELASSGDQPAATLLGRTRRARLAKGAPLGGSQLEEGGDSDQDEWLSQANAMLTTGSPEEYPDPEPVPDVEYPALLSPGGSARAVSAVNLDFGDYADLELDFQQQQQQQQQPANTRNKRQVSSQIGDTLNTPAGWLKFPQSRRTQVYPNGTLVIQDVSRQDQGFYRCRVLAATHWEQQVSQISRQPLAGQLNAALSNALFLSVLVPPVISPFGSPDTLREGMRNFLTCSVIEGDSPVQLRWLKDNQPIEELTEQQQQQQQQQLAGSSVASSSRVRVETNNEFTSTLYFSHVDFKDNGNYTCMATNKAASVNYTARVLVNVPPKWIKAPKDLECVAGQSIVIDCQAQAYPSARVWWELGVYSPPGATGAGNGNKQSASAPSSFEQKELQQQQQQQQQQQSAAHNRAAKLAGAPSAEGQLSSQAPNHYRTIISNSRIHILENASLVIRDATKQDQAYYLCQAANNFGSLSALIKLTVNVGASFSSKYLVRYAKLNERVELDCDPIGQSQVQLIWSMRPTNQSPSISGASRINQLRSALNSSAHPTGAMMMNMMMMYESASHDRYEQTGASSNFPFPPNERLNSPERLLLFSGTIRTEIPALSEQQTTGGASQSSADSSLTHVSASSRESGQQISFLAAISAPENPALSFETLKRADGRGELVRLVIRQVRRFHSADFVCQASNQYGADEKLIKLLVQEPPDPVEELSLVQVSSRSLTVSWTPPFNGNSPINSYTVEWAPVTTESTLRASNSSSFIISSSSSNNNNNNNRWSRLSTQLTSAQLTNLVPLVSYEIRVRAQNQLGQSALLASSPLIAQTSEEAPAAPPLDIQTIPLSSSSVRVSWLPPPSPSPAVPLRPETTQEVAEGGGGGAATLQHPSSAGNRAIHPTNTPSKLFTSHQSATLMWNSLSSQAASGAASTAPPTTAAGGSSIRGYYVGYRVLANSSLEPYVFKAVQLSAISQVGAASGGLLMQAGELAYSNNTPNVEAQRLARLSVQIGELKRNTRYDIIVQAFNSAGPGPQSDPVEARTLLEDPPAAPQLRVGLSTYTSIELQWSFPEEDNAHQVTPLSSDSLLSGHSFAPPTGYQLHYRLASPEGSPWLERKLSAQLSELQPASSEHQTGVHNPPTALQLVPQALKMSQVAATNLVASNATPSNTFGSPPFRYVLEQLSCGRAYQIYLVAYNSIGFGPASQIVRGKTRGGLPIAPRRQDYIMPNVSWAQVNLDTWMDAGCSITNFEIRYRRSERPANHQAVSPVSSDPSSAPSMQFGLSNFDNSDNSSWLLVSNKVSPEQRTIELHDLEPESWYILQTIAQSDAGKTQASYPFMTLDKLGRLPLDAVEAFGERQLGGSGGLPALFKSGSSSIRSIFYGNNFNNASALLISGCMCLILFATCSLFLIRRYNNLMKDTNSLNSQQTAASTATGTHYEHNSRNQHHHHQHQPYLPQHQFLANQSARQIQNFGPAAQEHYSLKVSPCKPSTESTSILTDGFSGNPSSQVGPYLNGSSVCTSNADNFRDQISNPADIPVSLEQQLDSFMSTSHQAQVTGDTNQLGFSPVNAIHRAQANLTDDYCRRHCESPLSPQAKFMTLSIQREANGNMEQQSQQLQRQQQVRFKTLPHRPLSSFISQQQTDLGHPVSPTCQQRYLCNQNVVDNHPHHQQQQVLEEQQKQQLYSKLRLICNSQSSYNICQNGQEELQQQPHQISPSNLSNETGQPVYNPDTYNMALLASQQNHQKLFTACTLKRDSNLYSPAINRCVQADEQVPEPGELTSLLLDCQQQLIEQNHNALNYCQFNGKGNFNNSPMAPPSVNGSSASTNNSSNFRVTSSSVSSNDQQQNTTTSSVTSSLNTPGQFINIANGNSNTINSPINQQCQKAQHLKQVNGASVNQMNSTLPSQAPPTTNSNGFNNEQSDYALPFPPKWV